MLSPKEGSFRLSVCTVNLALNLGPPALASCPRDAITPIIEQPFLSRGLHSSMRLALHMSKAPKAPIVAVTCEAHRSTRDFATELLRVNFVGGEIGHKGKRLDFYSLGDVVRMPSLPVFIDGPDNDI